MIVKNDIDVENKDQIIEEYNVIYGNEKLSNFIYKFWGDKKMIRTFPNLKVLDKNGNMIYFGGLLDIQTYYFKIMDKSNKNEDVVNEIRGTGNG